MQYHLDGFRSGNPHIKEKARGLHHGANDIVDVLVVGSGPAGLTLAAQLSAFEDINTKVIERKEGPLELGQADGLSCRTLEMFEAFGFSDRVIREAYNVIETVFWGPAATKQDHIARSGRIQDVTDDLSEMPHLILNQARVHDMYLQVMLQSARRLIPEYACDVVDLDSSSEAEFVSVSIKNADHNIETVKARYVVGCDGARSTVRQCIGLTLEGDSANQAWGVMDVLLVTDFPDIRFKSVIRSSRQGNILIIPREGGYLVRLYIELDKLAPGERVATKKNQPDDLINAAKRIFQPYSLDVKEVVWWSVYEIGQRLCHQFDNSDLEPSGAQSHPRVFIAGDACHTHSPKAGQGMNVGMADSFNLGWKLAAVLRGQAHPGLLKSYSAERQAVASDLIEFDRHWAARFSEAAEQSDSDASQKSVKDFQHYYSEHGRYTAGVAVTYSQSAIVADKIFQNLATGLPIGMRFHSSMVTRIADALPMQLGHTIKADGRWRLIVFASQHNPAKHTSPLWQLCEFLSSNPMSPMQLYQQATDDPDLIIDLRVVLQQNHDHVNMQDLHPSLLPAKGALGLQDNEKVFSATTKNNADIFDKRQVDRCGCMVLVRPDQYIADVLPLENTQRLVQFFGQILKPI